jgi:hypothetical protein
VVAFGFVIEKLDLFVHMVMRAHTLGLTHRSQLEKLSEPLGRYEGLPRPDCPVIVAAARVFTRSGRSKMEKRSSAGVRTERIFVSVLVLFAVGLSVHLALGA